MRVPKWFKDGPTPLRAFTVLCLKPNSGLPRLSLCTTCQPPVSFHPASECLTSNNPQTFLFFPQFFEKSLRTARIAIDTTFRSHDNPMKVCVRLMNFSRCEHGLRRHVGESIWPF